MGFPDPRLRGMTKIFNHPKPQKYLHNIRFYDIP